MILIAGLSLVACGSLEHDVPFISASAAEVGPIDAMVFYQVLAEQPVDGDETQVQEVGVLVALTFRPSITAPLPLGDRAEACWQVSELVAPAPASIEGITVEVGGMASMLEPGSDGVFIGLLTGGTEAGVSPVGDELIVEGSSTAVFVPTPMELREADHTWDGLHADGLLAVQWSRDATAASAFVSIDLFADGNWFQCALRDDGKAFIDVGFVPSNAELVVGRHDARLVETPLGSTYVAARQDVEFVP